MKFKIQIMLLIMIVVFVGGAFGQGIRSVAPNGTGLSNERLERITAVMNDHVAKGHIAGAIGFGSGAGSTKAGPPVPRYFGSGFPCQSSMR